MRKKYIFYTFACLVCKKGRETILFSIAMKNPPILFSTAMKILSQLFIHKNVKKKNK